MSHSWLLFSGRSKRTIQYSSNEDMHAYVASGKRLPGAIVRLSDLAHPTPCHPVQWNAWLTHTRRNPPTLEVRSVLAGIQSLVDSNISDVVPLSISRNFKQTWYVSNAYRRTWPYWRPRKGRNVLAQCLLLRHFIHSLKTDQILPRRLSWLVQFKKLLTPI